jgi:hypothetical protein
MHAIMHERALQELPSGRGVIGMSVARIHENALPSELALYWGVRC